MPGAMYGFRDSIVLRIYYHEPGVVVVQKTADFTIMNPILLSSTRSLQTEPAHQLNPLIRINPEIPSTASGNQAFFQPITSLYTKLLFPTISNLLAYQDYLAVMKAALVIKPVQGTYSPLYDLPPVVNLSLTNRGQHDR